MTRRQAVGLAVGAGLGGAALVAFGRAWRPVRAGEVDARRFEADPALPPEPTFPLSVASGDPTPSGAVVWTRVASERWTPDEPLALEVAADERFADVLHRALLPAAAFGPATDHTARLDLHGHLPADARCFYRFVHRGVRSRTGRLRTLPAPSAEPRRLRLGVVTCQSWQGGYYAAFDHLADDDLDLLVHMGDLIYEFGGEGRVPGRDLELPSGSFRAESLDDFRHLHRTYRTDRSWQRALERHTLVATWDDHEIANNRWWDVDDDRPRFPNHPADASREASLALQAAAVRAWWEYVPSRAVYEPDEPHPHRQFRLFRSLRWGRLAELVVSDERLYRSGPPCGTVFERNAVADCPERHDPSRTMLGPEQRAWFERAVTSSAAAWKVWVNGVVLGRFRDPQVLEPAYLYLDSWEAFTAERQALFRRFRDANVRNLVALTGDWHAYLAGYMLLDYDEPRPTEADRVGVEFMTPSVTSDNLFGRGEDPTAPAAVAYEAAVLAANPWLVFHRGLGHGYTTIELTGEACTYRAYAVDRNAPRAPSRLVKVLRVPAGRVELEDATPGQL